MNEKFIPKKETIIIWVVSFALVIGYKYFTGKSETQAEKYGKVILADRFKEVCTTVEDIKQLEWIEGTATPSNFPAYVARYDFLCRKTITEDERWNLYIGWVDMETTGSFECIHNHPEKNEVLEKNWWQCGGNFKLKGDKAI